MLINFKKEKLDEKKLNLHNLYSRQNPFKDYSSQLNIANNIFDHYQGQIENYPYNKIIINRDIVMTHRAKFENKLSLKLNYDFTKSLIENLNLLNLHTHNYIPKRLQHPLIKIDPILIESMSEGLNYEILEKSLLRINHKTDIVVINEFMNEIFPLIFEILLRNFKVLKDTDLSLLFCDCSFIASKMKKYVDLTTHDNEIIEELIKDFKLFDIETCLNNNLIKEKSLNLKQVPLFLKFMIEFKYKPIEDRFISFEMFINQIKENPLQSVKMAFKGLIITYLTNEEHIFFCVQSGNVMYYFDTITNTGTFIFCEYFDYMLTTMQIELNLIIMSQTPELEKYKNLINLILDYYHDTNIKWENKVEMMKNFESLTLMKADIIDTDFINWLPIKDVLMEMIKLDTDQDELEIWKMKNLLLDESIEELFISPSNIIDYFNSENVEIKYIHKFLLELSYLEGQDLLQVAALHKSMFYAEIDEFKGLQKFMERVHTLRPCSNDILNNMSNYMKMEFISNYTKRHSILPNIEGPESKMIFLEHIKKQPDEMMQIRIDWWSDIVIKQTILPTDNKQLIVYSKDKSCTKPEISFCPNDSGPELLELIETDDQNNYVINNDDLKYVNDSSISIIYKPTNEIKFQMDNSCRLFPKEREQKGEGRFFGTTTRKLKQVISYLMDNIKLVLNYFNGQFMTITSSQRSIDLHEAAQQLNAKDTYSLLLDIQGHNQSMQFHNVRPILDICCNILGLNFNNISNMFNHLVVYYVFHYLEITIVSTGQLGGIEGWMNPLWTLHTLILSKLLKYNLSFKIIKTLTYSDDIDIIMKYVLVDKNDMDELYKRIVKHYFSCGMLVKPSQTILSKNRVTLLRKSFFKGIITDNTMKKLLSINLFNDDIILSNCIEQTSINSSINSSLDDTNILDTVLNIKWYYTIINTFYAFCNSFHHMKKDNLLFEYLKNNKSLTIFYEVLNDNYTKISKDELAKFFTSNWISGKKQDIKIAKNLNDYFKDIKKIRQLINESIKNLILKDDFIKAAYFSLVFSDERVGGFGADLLINEIISGHSNGFQKKIYYFLQGVDLSNVITSNMKSYIYRIVSISLHNLRVFDKDDYPKLLMHEYPIINDLTTDMQILKSFIQNQLNKKTKNTMIKEYLNQHKMSTLLANELVELSKDRFHYRISSFYYEHSIIHMVDYVINKFKSSKSYCVKLGDVSKLQKLIFKNNNKKINIFFKNRTVDLLITEKIDINDYLIMLRNINTNKKIKYIDIIEPLYDNIINTEYNTTRSIMTYTRSQNYYVNENSVNYKHLEQSELTVYKTDRDEFNLIFDTTEAMLAYELIAITNWILFKSLKMHNFLDDKDIGNYNIVRMCNHSLRTLNKDLKYINLASLVKLPRGGEILHRINNLNFKNKSYIRSLPRIMTQHNCRVNSTIYHKLNLTDSNINLDYLRFRIIVKHGLADYYGNGFVPKYTYNIEEVHYIRDVNINFLILINKPNAFKMGLENNFDLGKFEWKFKVLSNRLKQTNDGQYYCTFNILDTNLINNKKIIHETNQEILSDKIIFYHNTLINDNVVSIYTFEDSKYWNDFIRYNIDLFSKDPILEIKEILYNYIDKKIELRQKTENINTIQLIEDLIFKFELGDIIDLLKESESLLKVFMESFNDLKENYNFNKTNFYKSVVNYKNKKRILIKHVVYYVLIKKCLYFEISNNEIHINYYNTDIMFKHYLSLFRESEKYVKENPEIYLIFLLFNESEIKHNYEFNCEKYYLEIEEKIKELDIYDYIDYKYTYDIKSVYTFKFDDIPDYFIKNKDSMTKYIMRHFPLAEIAKVTLYQNIINSIEDLFYAFGNLEVYNSPTYSGIFFTAYSLLKMLIEEKHLSKKDFICDLTAGRGDFKIASDMLNLNMTSYSKKDNYTSVNTYDQVYLLENYDVFDLNRLDFIDNYNVFILDISFVNKPSDFKNKYTNLIKNILSRSKMFILRLNTCEIDKNKIIDELEEFNVYIAYSIKYNMPSKYIYLIFIRRSLYIFNKESEEDKALEIQYNKILSERKLLFENLRQTGFPMIVNKSLKDNKYLYDLFLNFTQYFVKQNALFSDFNTMYLPNSMKLNKDVDLESLLKNIYNPNIFINKQMNKLLKHSILIKAIPISKTYMNFIKKKYPGVYDDLMNSKDEMLSIDYKAYISKNRSKYKDTSKSIHIIKQKELTEIENDDIIKHINIFNIKYSSAEILAISHSFKEVRNIAYAFIMLKDLDIILNSQTDISNYLEKNNEKLKTRGLNRLLPDAIFYLLYSVKIRNFDTVLLHLYQLLRYNKRKMVYFCKVIYQFKSFKSIYKHLITQNISFSDQINKLFNMFELDIVYTNNYINERLNLDLTEDELKKIRSSYIKFKDKLIGHTKFETKLRDKNTNLLIEQKDEDLKQEIDDVINNVFMAFINKLVESDDFKLINDDNVQINLEKIFNDHNDESGKIQSDLQQIKLFIPESDNVEEYDEVKQRIIENENKKIFGEEMFDINENDLYDDFEYD